MAILEVRNIENAFRSKTNVLKDVSFSMDL